VSGSEGKEQSGLEPLDEAPSKSALKREMTARQELGEALCALSERELARIPIDDDALLEAIRESQRISHHSARRRHRQYIGKLMRRIDPEPLQTALDALHREKRGDSERLHEIEGLRDTLLAKGDGALAQVIERFPGADRQQLRQLTREAQRERDGGLTPKATRRLFRYLRELQSAH
jgi:ribosome-associated protein